MKKILSILMMILLSQLIKANIVLTSANGSSFQSGVPFSVDLTFSNLPTTCAITHVKIAYTATVSNACVPGGSVKTIGGTYWGSGVGSNPNLANVAVGGSTFPITTNMLPIFSGISANAIMNIVTSNGVIPSGTTITINATASYYNSATATTACFTEPALPIIITITAQNNITTAINTTCATAKTGGYQVFNCSYNSPNTTGSLQLYNSTPNLTFNFPTCASVYNVYDENWNLHPFTFTSGQININTGNIIVNSSKIYRIVLFYPCPGTAPCTGGNNINTSLTLTGNDICGNAMSKPALLSTCAMTTGSCLPPGPPPPPGLAASISNYMICPGACGLENVIKLENLTSANYPNSTLSYTMPNTTTLTSLNFTPALPPNTNITITNSGTGCAVGPYINQTFSGTSLNTATLNINGILPSCTTKTIKITFPSPMIAPYSIQTIKYKYNVTSNAPTSGLATFPYTFTSSVLTSPASGTISTPYVNCSPVVSIDNWIMSGTNCVGSAYFNPGQMVKYRMVVTSSSPTPITNMVLSTNLNSNIIIDQSYGVKYYWGPSNVCSGLPFTSASIPSSNINVSGNILNAGINLTTNKITITCPNLIGSASCGANNYFIVEFQARVKDGTPVASYPSTITLAGSNTTTQNSSQCFAIVNSYYELAVRMRVKRDNGIFVKKLTSCVCNSSTLPNANKIQFRGELINTGNVTIRNLNFFNMKPKGGDLSFSSSCTPTSRGTSTFIDGTTSYSHAFNTNNRYSLVPLNYPNANNSGWLYSGGTIPSGQVIPYYNASGNPNFNSPSLPLCSSCPTCVPYNSVSTPVNFGSAHYRINGIDLKGGQSLSFYTNPVCIQNIPNGTVLVNNFNVQGLRTDLNLLTPLLKSEDDTVTINTSNCTATGCDSTTVRYGINAPEDIKFDVCNQSGAIVNKVKIDILPTSCYAAPYSYTTLVTLLPGACTTIFGTTIGLPILVNPPCQVSYKVTLYSQTATGPPATYDSCSKTTTYTQTPYKPINNTTEIGEEILVFPVPVAEFIIVNADNYFKKQFIISPVYSFVVYDVSGKIISNYECKKVVNHIPLNALRSGLYFYKIIHEGKVIKCDKFIKE